jgi:hypothetical protein
VLIHVVGRTVRLQAATSYDGVSSTGLNVGDFVEVSGTPSADGSILAERLTRVTASATSHYVGRMTSIVPGRQMTIDTMLTVDISDVPAVNVPAGTRMIVQGVLGGVGTPRAARGGPHQPTRRYGRSGRAARTRRAHRCRTVFLAGQPIAIDAASFENVTLPRALEVGTLVRVDGELSADGRLAVRRLTDFVPP